MRGCTSGVGCAAFVFGFPEYLPVYAPDFGAAAIKISRTNEHITPPQNSSPYGYCFVVE